MALALAVLCVTVASCAGASSSATSGRSTEPTGSATVAAKKPRKAGLHVVALGDSETAGNGDPTGLGWVQRYARLVRKRLGVRVDVQNLAQDGQTSQMLLSNLGHDPTTRADVKRAEIVLLGIGGADLNAGDDNFAAGKCRAEACYAPVLKSFALNFDAIVAAVRKLRRSKTTLIRSITQPNVLTGAEDVIPQFLKRISTRIGVYQATTANRAICAVMSKYSGRCIDVLGAFNGPHGTANAYKKGLLNHQDCCYPSAAGQQLIAELLLKTGLAPLR